MASPFSTEEIRDTLAADKSTKRTPRIWTYVTTKDQGCAACKGKIRSGGSVSVSYDGVMARFTHAGECPPVSPKNDWKNRVIQGSK